MKNEYCSLVHSIHVSVAMVCSLAEAHILEHIFFWVQKNEANGKNFFDGRYWTYNSINAFNQLFPYLSTKQIRSALAKLESRGLVLCGNYNKSSYDRTKWYALTDEAYELFGVEKPVPQNEEMEFDENATSICPNGQMEFPKRANGISLEGKSICPGGRTNTSIKPVLNTALDAAADATSEIDTETMHAGAADADEDTSAPSVPKPSEHRSQSKARKQRNGIPSISEVEEFCKKERLSVNAKEFYEACERRGWKDPEGSPISDWHRYLKGWERNGGAAFGTSREGVPERGRKNALTFHGDRERDPGGKTKTVEEVMEECLCDREMAMEIIEEGLA